MPACRLIDRILQRVLPSGGRIASVTTRASVGAESDALRPRPGLSSRPARPALSNRFDHIDTRFGVVFSCAATASTPTPSSRRRMISARWRSRTPIVVARDRRRSSFTTSGSARNCLIGRAIPAILPLIDRTRQS